MEGQPVMLDSSSLVSFRGSPPRRHFFEYLAALASNNTVRSLASKHLALLIPGSEFFGE